MELHINYLLSALNGAGCRNRTSIGTERVEGVEKRRRCGMHAGYEDGLRQVVTRDLSINPREGRVVI